MAALGLVLAGLSGLIIGSFVNVVVDRVPREESLVSAKSHCPACGTPVRRWHNVPVASWLVQRGRFASCGTRISPRYPLVEVGTAVLFVVLEVRLDALGQLAAVPAFLYFAAVGLALALIDVRTHRLPDRLVLPSYPVLAVLLAGAAGWRVDWWSFVRALIGSAALYACFFLAVRAYPAGMGFGDAKLAGLTGGVLAYLSWSTLLIGAFAGFLLAGVVGVVLIATGRAGRTTAIPFGPFMLLGALLGVFVAVPVAD